MAPKISLIVTVYNAEKFLRRCLDSLVNQTLKDIEIICVNDGSTDGSLEILREYESKDIRVKVLSQTNSGTGGGRNTALQAAFGDFICISDSDDYRALDCLEKLYNAAIKYNTDSAFGDVYRVTEFDEEYCSNFIDPRPYDKILDATTSFYDSIFQWQSIFKRDCIKDIRYVENTDYEDSAYVSEVLMNINSTVHVKDAIYYYRLRENSSAAGKTYKIFKTPVVLKRMKENLEKYKNSPKFYHLQLYYKRTIEFLLNKAFFIRMPDDASYLKIWKLYFDFCEYMSFKQKIKYFRKIVKKLPQYLLFPLLKPVIKVEKRKYYKFIILFSFMKFKILRKHGNYVKKSLRKGLHNKKI